jgi:23S rRNA pseudouridine1911/1915/1917 synthase
MTAKGEIRHVVDTGPDNAGKRLDRLLADALSDLSRSRIKALILSGSLVAGGETITDPSYRVKPGQRFALTVPEPVPAKPEGQDIALTVVHEDADLIVIDKPAGLVVHPAAGNLDHTLVNALIAHCGASLSGIGGVLRPGIVHRLDKDTSGLIVAAKNDAAHASLAAQFADRSLTRVYHAVVWGLPSPSAGEIEGAIGRSPRNRKKMAVVTRGGKSALTRYRLIEAFGASASLVECRLATGRTHQIRVHMTHVGHPVIGDPLYGRGGRRGAKLDNRVQAAIADLGRQALHAHLMKLRHPRSHLELSFESELPTDIKQLIEVLRDATRI